MTAISRNHDLYTQFFMHDLYTRMPRTYIHIHLHTYKHTNTSIHTLPKAQTPILNRTHAYTHAYAVIPHVTHTYIHTYIHIHTTHTQVSKQREGEPPRNVATKTCKKDSILAEAGKSTYLYVRIDPLRGYNLAEAGESTYLYVRVFVPASLCVRENVSI